MSLDLYNHVFLKILYKKLSLAAVGFEFTPPERLEPKTSVLDRSATLLLVATRNGYVSKALTPLHGKYRKNYFDARINAIQVGLHIMVYA